MATTKNKTGVKVKLKADAATLIKRYKKLDESVNNLNAEKAGIESELQEILGKLKTDEVMTESGIARIVKTTTKSKSFDQKKLWSLIRKFAASSELTTESVVEKVCRLEPRSTDAKALNLNIEPARAEGTEKSTFTIL